MSQIADKLHHYQPYQNVFDKGLKVAAYLGEFCGVCGYMTGLSPLQKLGWYRQFLWGASAYRDLIRLGPKLFQQKEGEEVDFKLAYLLSFRSLFVVRTALKLFNWLSPHCYVDSLIKGLGKFSPAYIMTFAAFSLLQTSRKKELDRKDYLSIVDDVAELVCTGIEGQFFPGFCKDACINTWSCSRCISATAGLISGLAGEAKAILVVAESKQRSVEAA